ncbi:MAG: hypothetical protein M3680_11170 [Myxococcota bacterium]|nr:hypothetical protein [Myxococcota bacterium]
MWFLDDELAPIVPIRPRPAPERAEAVAAYALPAPRSRVRTALSSPALMHFNRLIALAVLGNVVLAVELGGTLSAVTLSHLVLGNFAVGIVIRQQYVVNLLFWIATRAPTSWPLAIRATCGKVYHFGGIHVGCMIAGTAWYLAFVVELVGQPATPAVLAVVIAQLAILLGITVMSLPRIRAQHHDTFERVKRFGGWTSLALFWLQTALLLDAPLLTAPEIWVLALITTSVALPWLRLKKVPVELVVPSKHVALARFDHGETPFAGSSTAISRSPLLEWHSFANVPTPGQPGFRLTISRAGDWTGRLIDDRPTHVWVKGITTAGVANIEVLFKKVVYIATGSGIGPCLPHLLAQQVPAKLIWATRDPRATYGDGLVDEILAAHPDALIWDTHKQGKPDMVKLAHRACIETGAEAVICISNKALTWQVVTGLESRGIPAYGAIWDS